MEKMVEVKESYLRRLEKESMKLGALEEAGVDNWSGWDDAMQIYREMLKED